MIEGHEHSPCRLLHEAQGDIAASALLPARTGFSGGRNSASAFPKNGAASSGPKYPGGVDQIPGI
jgi:hypothetical protein